jgi:hypothetical protein
MHPQDKQFFLIERLHRPNILWRFWLKVLFRSSWSNFLSREGLTSSQEKERQRDQERKLREQMWNMFVYSPSPPTTHLEVIRAVRHAPLLSLLPGPPPPHGSFPIGTVRDLSIGSLWWPLIWRLWVCELILDSDGDPSLFPPIFCRM